jgi:hypothetical protein
MNESSVGDYITKTFPGVETTTAFGYTFFFYRSERKLPFATLISSDQDYDRLSNLDRPGVFRLILGSANRLFNLYSVQLRWMSTAIISPLWT